MGKQVGEIGKWMGGIGRYDVHGDVLVRGAR